MVVVLIIGILIAIGLPTFLGAKARAQDRSAQASLNNGYKTARVYYSTSGTFVGFDAATAGVNYETGVQWVDTAAPIGHQVSIVSATGTDVLLVALSATGTYWCIGQTGFIGNEVRGRGTWAAVNTVASCNQGW